MLTPEERYRHATREHLLAVVAAADSCWRIEAEFGQPAGMIDSEFTHALDTALEQCPGTSAANYRELRAKAGLENSPP